jgi:hypothetical protein
MHSSQSPSILIPQASSSPKHPHPPTPNYAPTIFIPHNHPHHNPPARADSAPVALARMVSGPSNTMQPPATGAPTPLGTSTLSPVNMDSSTAARPSRTSASHGTRSPVQQQDTQHGRRLFAKRDSLTHEFEHRHQTYALVMRSEGAAVLLLGSPPYHHHTAPTRICTTVRQDVKHTSVSLGVWHPAVWPTEHTGDTPC